MAFEIEHRDFMTIADEVLYQFVICSIQILRMRECFAGKTSSRSVFVDWPKQSMPFFVESNLSTKQNREYQSMRVGYG